MVENLQPYYVTRLVTVVRRDCKEWMSGNESLAIVVFPPHSLPTDNQHSVQVIIQNGNSGFVLMVKPFGLVVQSNRI